MSNLKPLVWKDYGNGTASESRSALHEYDAWKTGDNTGWVVGCFDRRNPDGIKEATGFSTMDEAKEWCWRHYNEEMQPYVVPSPTWISVDDRLPSELKVVLITYEAELNFQPRKFISIALREGGDWLGIDDMFGGYVFDDEYNADKFNDDLHGFNITHWMPIPEFKQGE